MNKALLIGILQDNIKTTHMDSGKTRTLFKVQTSESFDYQGQARIDNQYHRVVFYGLTPGSLKYLNDSIGKIIQVEGRIETYKFTGDDGNSKFQTQIVGLKWEILHGL